MTKEIITYKKTIEIEKPILRISYDLDPESPREWGNLGVFVTNENGYLSPDGKDNIYYRAMVETENDVSSCDEHIEAMTKFLSDGGIKIKSILPITRHEHGNVIYRLGRFGGFDNSHCGFYFVPKTELTDEEIEKKIGHELQLYSSYANGDVYEFRLYDKEGELVDSCCGFYDIEDIREHLPAELKDADLFDYFVSE